MKSVGGSDTGFSGGNDGAAGNVITFDASNFYDGQAYSPADSVYVGNGSDDAMNGTAKNFGFTVASKDYDVTDVYLSIVHNGSTIAKASSFLTGPDTGVTISYTLLPQTARNAPTKGTITIIDTNSVLASGYDSTALYFEVLWTQTGGSSGASYSRSFAFVDPADLVAGAVPTTLLAQFANTEPVRSASYIHMQSSVATTVSMSATTTASMTKATNTDTSASLTGPAKSGGSSGLGKGAIAGIAVGTIAAVAIIAAIVFFVLCRHRKRRLAKDGYKSALLANPVDSYRGAGRNSILGRPNADVTFVKMDNLGEKNTLGGDAGTAERGSSGPNTPQKPPAVTAPAMRSQVAALIEDDMTPEDVARLEAEERELDADIENAMRRRADASGRQG
ncbi:hypothetical protein SEPCBS119000_005628 [Sporothrix epigloea]|uniref:Uncharacterized protein n=1 Tax=Sporothrix epigloea TaxID=1892477 RepID=A0ABP0E0J0_9PEZI